MPRTSGPISKLADDADLLDEDGNPDITPTMVRRIFAPARCATGSTSLW
jgi:hypothetical protein